MFLSQDIMLPLYAPEGSLDQLAGSCRHRDVDKDGGSTAFNPVGGVPDFIYMIRDCWLGNGSY